MDIQNSAVSTPLRWIFKTALQKASHSLISTCNKSAASLLEGGEWRYIKAVNNNVIYIYGIVQELCESRGGRPGLSVLTSLLVSVDVKQY